MLERAGRQRGIAGVNTGMRHGVQWDPRSRKWERRLTRKSDGVKSVPRQRKGVEFSNDDSMTAHATLVVTAYSCSIDPTHPPNSACRAAHR